MAAHQRVGRVHRFRKEGAELRVSSLALESRRDCKNHVVDPWVDTNQIEMAHDFLRSLHLCWVELQRLECISVFSKCPSQRKVLYNRFQQARPDIWARLQNLFMRLGQGHCLRLKLSTLSWSSASLGSARFLPCSTRVLHRYEAMDHNNTYPLSLFPLIIHPESMWWTSCLLHSSFFPCRHKLIC